MTELASVPDIQKAAGLGIPQTRKSNLSADYTLSAADDGYVFFCTTTLTVTVPAGLSPMPTCVFLPPQSGSVTLHPTGGATLSGGTSDIAVNISTNPAGAALVAQTATDAYGVTVAGTAWSALTGQPTDNSAFSTFIAGYATVNPGGSKQSAGYTLSAADNGGFIWLAAQAADKTFSVPATLPNNFRCFVGYLNSSSAAGRLKLATSGGSTFNWSTSAAPGTLQTGTNVFLGTASTTSIAVAMIVSEGSQPGGAFFIVPMIGAVAAT